MLCSFAAKKGESIASTIAEYDRRANKSTIDYSYHLILLIQMKM